MEGGKGKNGRWLSVPQFGDWDEKGEVPDYSMDFSKIREVRKLHKKDSSRASVIDEDEFINPTATMPKADHTNGHEHYHWSQQHSPTKNGPWLSVPQFGDWDQKGEVPDYSLDFSKIREMRKLNKKDASRASLGNEDEFINPTATMPKADHTNGHEDYHQRHQHSPTARRGIFSYFNCCVKA